MNGWQAFIHTHARTHARTHTHTHTCMQTYEHTYTDTHVHTHTCMHKCMHTNTHRDTDTYTHVHVCACAHTRTQLHTYIHTYTHSYKHIHICTSSMVRAAEMSCCEASSSSVTFISDLILAWSVATRRLQTCRQASISSSSSLRSISRCNCSTLERNFLTVSTYWSMSGPLIISIKAPVDAVNSSLLSSTWNR